MWLVWISNSLERLNYINMLEILLWYKFTFHLYNLFILFFSSFLASSQNICSTSVSINMGISLKTISEFIFEKNIEIICREAVKHYVASHCMFILRGTCKELGTLSSLHTQLVVFYLKQTLKVPLKMKSVWHTCRIPPM